MVDGTVSNPAVSAAYARGEYTTKDGTTYKRGMDGWFEVHDGEGIHLVRHHDMANLIAEEADSGSQ
jgi:hypothetical protein